MEAYFEVKSRLFKHLQAASGKGNAIAVLNMDDPMADALKSLTDAPVMTYGTTEGTDVRAENIRLKKNGLRAELMTPKGKLPIRSGLMGNFNIHNIMAAVAAALTVDVPLDVISIGIERVAGVPGRMEQVPNTASKTLVVDYAHTPDALSKAIRAMKKHITGRMITVFGCGGDRDQGKRAAMGRVAGRLSDRVIITSDNPRTEDPSAIADEIKKGVMDSGLKDYILELDRKRAIFVAVKMAQVEDGVLIAGKGHETHQIIGEERKPFDDRTVAQMATSLPGCNHRVDDARPPDLTVGEG